MSTKKILYISVTMRVCIVIVGIGLLFFRCLQSINPLIEIPIIEAAALGQPDKIKQLLHNGESVNIVDGDNNNALTFAVWNGIYPANQQCVEILLQNQANTRCRNKEGIAVVQQVVKIDDKELRMRMIGKIVKFGGKIDNVDNRGFDVLQKNLETYDTITTSMILDWWGRLISAPMLNRAKKRALEYNLRDILDVLNKGIPVVKHDAHWNPNATDRRTGLNDLHYAVINGDKKMVETTLSHGAQINKSCDDEYGMGPLHLAVLQYDTEMVAYLLSKKADANKRNLQLNSPLHMVAWLNDPAASKKIADILLQNGANINAQNKDGNTLLHMLIYNNNRSLIHFLNGKYALNKNIPNNDKETAVQLAERLKRRDLLELGK